MPTNFASYDIDQDGVISSAEWDQFYGQPARGGGGMDPNNPSPDVPAGQPFDFDAMMSRLMSGQFTDDDLLGFSNWIIGQQMGQQAGQLDYQNRYLDYLNGQLGNNEQALAIAKQELDFQQGPYWEYYTQVFMPQQMELNTLGYDTQKQVSAAEQAKAKDYALAQFYNTEQAKYGADAARYQYLQATQSQPSQAGRRRPSRSTRAALGAY